MKICTKCKKRKRKDAFRTYSGRSQDGLRPLCRKCQLKYEKHWRLMSAEKLRKARWIRSPQTQAYARNYRVKNKAAYLAAECRRRCLKKGLEYNLDVAELQRRIELGVCELTGYPLELSPVNYKWERRPNTPSLDRINPKEGYTMKNVRVVCTAVNLALSNWGEEALLPIVRMWARKV